MTIEPHRRASSQRVQAALDLRRYREALPEALLLVAQNPEDEDAHALLALVYLNLGQNPEAQKTAETGLSLAPSSEWLHRIRALALVRQGKKHYKAALAAANEAVRLLPDHPSPYSVLAQVLSALRRFQDARETLLLAIELDPESPGLYFELGTVCLEIGKLHEAVKAFRGCLRLNPTNAMAHNNLGVAFLRLKRRKEAVEAFREAVRLDPTLDLAKDNAHFSVRNLVGAPEEQKGLGRLGLIWLIVHPAGLAIVILVSPFLYLYRLWCDYRANQRIEDLQHQDPETHRLYKQIDEDKKKGRL